MVKISGRYDSNLRCSLTHPSGSEIQTDAPKDNQGEGKFFSPTDLVAASLGSCMLTIIAIRARKRNIDIGNPSFDVEKIMASNPRRVSTLKLKIQFDRPIEKKDRTYLEEEARNCPVALSLAEELKQEVTFEYR